MSIHRLSIHVFIAMILGIAVGIILHITASDVAFVDQIIVGDICGLLGNIFIALLKMLVIPLVFVALVCGTCALKDPAHFGSIGLKTIILYLITTAIAISLSLLVAHSFHIGMGMHLKLPKAMPNVQIQPLTQVLLNIIPENLFAAMAQGKVLPMIV